MMNRCEYIKEESGFEQKLIKGFKKQKDCFCL